MPYRFAVPRVLTSGDELHTQELRWHSTIGDSINYLVGVKPTCLDRRLLINME